MARIIENDNGFKVIELSRREILKIGGYGICDFCDNTTKQGYYIAVLNQWLCPECYREFIRTATRYESDKRIEDKNFNWFRKIYGV